MKKGLNPKLNVGDRIVLVYMDGEPLGPGTKGKVKRITNVPKFSDSDSDYQYDVEWFDEEGKVTSTLGLIPELDAWMIDDEAKKDNIQEISFKNLDDLISKGDFLSVFSKKELEDVYKFFELERQIGSHNMFTEGGQFLLVGPDYITDFFNLYRRQRELGDDKEILIEKLIGSSQKMRDLFIRNSMKYIENQDKEPTINNIQRTMLRLANTAKQFWMSEANKFLNKEIE